MQASGRGVQGLDLATNSTQASPMLEATCLIDEIETALSTGTRGRRRDVLMQITDLFMTGSGHFSAEQVELFGEVFLALTAEMEEKARARLSQRLAGVGNAPRKL